jgi:hypothetical protein
MSSRSRVTHWQRPEELSPGAELDALAAVYSFILDCHAKKKEGGPATAPADDVKESNGYVAYKNHNR